MDIAKKVVLFIILQSLLFLLFISNHYFDINPDGISYLEVAQLYKNGFFYDAVNAYWSPFYSWVLVLISIFVDWLLAVKIVTLLLNMAWLLGSYLLAFQITNDKNQSLLILFGTFLFSGFYEMWKLITPDYLLAVYSVYILLFYFKLQQRNSPNTNWLVFGLLVGTGYLIKSYFLAFSILFFFILMVLFRFLNFRKKFFFLGVGIAIIVLIWASFIYWKYDRITMGTSAFINYNQFVLDRSPTYLKEPMSPPTNGTSYWSDPSEFVSLEFDLPKQLNAISDNFKVAFRFLVNQFHVGLIAALMSLNFIVRKNHTVVLLIFVIFWISLYSLILIEDRYLWPIIVPLNILIIHSLHRLRTGILKVHFLFALIVYSKTYVTQLPADPNTILHLSMSSTLKPPCTTLSNNWVRGLYVSYYSRCKYYGFSGLINDNRLLKKEIVEGNVTHILSFDEDTYENILFLQKMKDWNSTASLYKVELKADEN